MKYFVPLLFFLIFSLVGRFFASPNIVNAQQPPGIEGWYCVGNQPGTIWHQVPSSNPNQPDVQLKQEDCGADEQCAGVPPPNNTYFGDVACLKINHPPPRGTGIKMYTKPTGTITQGNQVTIGLTSSTNRTPACNGNINADDLKVFGRLQNCQVSQQTQCGCVTKNVPNIVCTTNPTTNARSCHQNGWNQVACGPSDWHIPPIVFDPANGNQLGFNPYDNNQCVAEITCTTNALGSLDLPYRPIEPDCWNDSVINVVAQSGQISNPPNPAASCAPSTQVIAAPNKDPSSILGDSLQDDLDNEKKLSVMLPDGVNNQLQQACASQDPQTGVTDSFLVQFICSFQNVPIVGQLVANLCPKEVNFVNQQTSCLTQTSTIVQSRTTPENLNAPPAQQACEILDFKDPATGQQVAGNKDISAISAQLGGANGTYSQDIPATIPIVTDVTQNLFTEGKVFSGDQRVPDINARCKVYSGANLPDGISFCDDASLTPP